jgi:tetratricopeptide (TPR) repeat protein
MILVPARAPVAIVFATAMGLAVWAVAHADDRPMSATVLGEENPQLAEGARALEAGHAEDGVRLTLEGLKVPASSHLVAAAHANLCAGYVLLHRYDEALVHCNTSISIDPENWRAYNNRAAVFSARSLFEEAIADVRTGLRLAPHSAVLQKSLTILYQNQKVQRRRGRSGSNA